jgi:DNA-binding NarL/FixJ family response regulator
MEVLVISNHALTVFGVRSLLCAVEPAVEVRDAAHMAQAMALLSGEHDFRVIVLDLDVHGMRPLMNAALLRDMWPDIPLVVIGSTACDPLMERALELGAKSYLRKREDTELLRESFRSILAGAVEPERLNESPQSSAAPRDPAR